MSKSNILIITILLLIILATIEAYYHLYPPKKKNTPTPAIMSPAAPTFHHVDSKRKKLILHLTEKDKNKTFDIMIGDVIQIEVAIAGDHEWIISQKGKALRMSHPWRPSVPGKMMIEYTAFMNNRSVVELFEQVHGEEIRYMEFRFVVGHTDFLTGFPSLYRLDMAENNSSFTLKVGERVAIDLPTNEKTPDVKWFIFKKQGDAIIIDKPFTYVSAVLKTDPKEMEICLHAYRPGNSTFILRYGDGKDLPDFTVHFTVILARPTLYKLQLENDGATVGRGDIIEFMLMGTKTSTQSWWNLISMTGNSVAMVGAWSFHPLVSTKASAPENTSAVVETTRPQLGYFCVQFKAYHLGTSVLNFEFVTRPSQKKTFTIIVVAA